MGTVIEVVVSVVVEVVVEVGGVVIFHGVFITSIFVTSGRSPRTTTTTTTDGSVLTLPLQAKIPKIMKKKMTVSKKKEEIDHHNFRPKKKKTMEVTFRMEVREKNPKNETIIVIIL